MPTHYKGSPSEIATLNAFIKLTRASNTLHQQLSRSLADYKLTESQFGVLEALYHLGSLNQRLSLIHISEPTRQAEMADAGVWV